LLANTDIDEYLLLGMYFSEVGSLSDAFLQSTEAAIISHRVSTAASLPRNIGDDAVRAKHNGLKIPS